MRKKRSLLDKYLGYLLISPAFLTLGLIIVMPLMIGIIMSFRQYSLIALSKGTTPFIGLANYKATLGDAGFWLAFKNTLWWTFSNVAGQIGFGLLVAVLLNQKVKGLFIYKTLLLIPWAIPASVAALNWMWLLHPDFGVINYLATGLGILKTPIPWLGHPFFARFWVVIARVWKEFPLSVIILLAALQTIPKEVYEAAEVDGATAWKSFRYITLPYLRSALVVASTLITIWTFNSFNMIWAMTRGGPVKATEILSTYIYKIGFAQYNFGLASAQSVLMVLILSLLIGIYIYRVEGKSFE